MVMLMLCSKTGGHSSETKTTNCSMKDIFHMWAAADEESHFQLREQVVLSVLDCLSEAFQRGFSFFFYLFRTSIMGVIRFLSVHYNSRGCVGKTWAGLYKSCKAACQAFLHVGCVLICMAKARGFIWFHTGGHTEVKRLRILVFFVKLSQFKHRRDRQKIR